MTGSAASPSQGDRSPREKLGVYDPRIQGILACADGPVFILGSEFEILDLNPEARELLDAPGAEAVLGARLGAAFGCLNAAEGPGGCGTAEGCGVCGALQVLQQSRRTGIAARNEFRLAGMRNQAFVAEHFRIKATPLQVQGRDLTVVALKDLRPEGERDALERLFFHDLRNALQSLEAWREGLKDRIGRCRPLTGELLGAEEESTVDAAGRKRFEALRASCEFHAHRLLPLLGRVEETVSGQQMLIMAERGEWSLQFVSLLPAEILGDLADHFLGQSLIRERFLEIQPSREGPFVSDRSLLLRVLVNMVKNALEATPAGGTVRVWHERLDGRPAFLVHNPGAIPWETRMQIFRRGFSTKGGTGRGLGTYGMKLFGERHLRGQVGFSSDPEAGTCFFIRLPARPLGS